VIVLPLAWAKLGQEGMHHILSLAQWDFWKTLPLYLQALFWDGSITFPYGSNWGGFLNPLLGALALVGFLHFRQTLPRPLFYGVVASFFFVLLPGIATSGFELYRILLILPLRALGRLLSNLSRPRALAFAGALLLGSLGLDLYNYVFHYSRIQGVPA